MNEKVLELIKFAQDRIDALSMRERILLTISSVVVLYMAWSFILYDIFLGSNEELMKSRDRVNQALSQVQAQVEEIGQVIGRDPTSSLIKKEQDLTAQNKVLNEQIIVETKKMVSPEEMKNILKSLVAEARNMTLVSMESLPATPLFPQDPKKAPVPGTIQVYVHSLKLEMLGDYFATVDFIKNIEKKKLNMVWDTLEYQVETYPNAKFSIQVHTLSIQEGFVSA